MTDAVVLLSGGKDSAIALWWAVASYDTVTAISITYPERPKAERLAARRLSERCRVAHVEPDLGFVATMRGGGGAASVAFVTANAYVPMRNLLFFAVAGYFAELLPAERIVAGQLQSDGMAYSDAAPAFFKQVERSFDESLRRSFGATRHVAIDLPLIDLADADAMRLGVRLGVPFDLTWSCLEDRQAPCGACVSCRDRRLLLG